MEMENRRTYDRDGPTSTNLLIVVVAICSPRHRGSLGAVSDLRAVASSRCEVSLG